MAKSSIIEKIVFSIIIAVFLIVLVGAFIFFTYKETYNYNPKIEHKLLDNKTLKLPDSLIDLKQNVLGLSIFDYSIPDEEKDTTSADLFLSYKLYSPNSRFIDFDKIFARIDDKNFIYDLELQENNFIINVDSNKVKIENLIKIIIYDYGANYHIYKKKKVSDYEKKFIIIWKKNTELIKLQFVYLNKNIEIPQLNFCDLRVHFTINHNKVFGYDNYPDLNEYELLDKNILENYGIKVGNVR